MKMSEETKFESFDCQFLRKILKIEQGEIILKWFGHLVRMNRYELAKSTMDWQHLIPISKYWLAKINLESDFQEVSARDWNTL